VLVVRVGREVQPVGQCRGAEREVALRVRRDGPEIDAEGVHAQRRHPVGARCREVGLGIPSLAEGQQPRPELAAVEAVAPAFRDRSKGSRRAGAPHACTRATSLRRELVEIHRRGGVHHRCRPGEERARGEAILGERDRRRQEGGERQRAEARVEGRPAVHATGHGDGADVVAERHDRVAVGAHGVGARA
jgi:hypothetical protein